MIEYSLEIHVLIVNTNMSKLKEKHFPLAELSRTVATHEHRKYVIIIDAVATP